METQATIGDNDFILPPHNVLEHIIYAASQAPSPENNQPWEFDISQNYLRLNYITSRSLKSDTKHTLNLISLGACLENLRLAALSEGFQTKIKILENIDLKPNPEMSIAVAEVYFIAIVKNFETSFKKENDLMPYLKLRHTDRSSYFRKKITSQSQRALSGCMGSNNMLMLVEKDAEIKEISKGIGVLDQLRLENRNFHTEVTKYLRFSSKKAQGSRDGIDTKTLAMPFGGKHFLKMLCNWSVFKFLNYFGIAKLLACMTQRQIVNSGALAIILSRDQSPNGIIQSGMDVQRLWITAEKEGLAIQPIGHFPVFKELYIGTSPSLKEKEIAEIKKAIERIERTLQAPKEYSPVMFLRVGYSKKRSNAKNYRYLPSEIIKSPAKESLYNQSFARNIGLLSTQEQEKLKHMTIALPGLGGVGSHHLVALCRLGIGGFHIADADSFSLANFNRQYGATISNLGRNKAEVMAEIGKDINPDLRLKMWNKFVDKNNVDAFLSGVDLVIDSLDAYNIEARCLIFSEAKKRKIPIISVGPVGFSAAMIVFTPESMGFEQYIQFDPSLSDTENFIRFIVGVTPRPYFVKYMKPKSASAQAQTAPSVSTSVFLCAGFAGVEAIKLLLDRGSVKAVPHYHYFDPYLMKFKVGYTPFGNRNPIQKILIKIVKSRMLK